ncbi:response regulator [Pantanalinema rosaneae CENA516]|uniref:response regulator n=1 Tax=Pantanalinema rosaneae TaxID=1620701 RepID=UPI003D6E2F57
MKILLVEDDEPTGQVLVGALTTDRYAVNLATDGQTGLDMAQAYEYDLILLDVGLPRLDGISVCRQLRSSGYQNPILLMTAKDSKTATIAGLDAGADDYVMKPCDIPELLARIRALLRRRSKTFTTALTWGDLQLNSETGEVRYQDTLITLTPKEFGLLELFMQYPQRIFSRSTILDRLWDMDDSPAESAVTTHIKDLRQRLKAAGMPIDPIDTVYGLGYRLKAPPKPEIVEPASDQSSAPIDAKERKKQQGLAHLQQLLERHRGSFSTQVAILEQAQAALAAGGMDSELRQQATREAHKLAGSLGIFGMPGGSTVAHAIEELLTGDRPLEQSAARQLTQLVQALQQEIAKPPQPLVVEPVVSTSTPLVLLVDDDRTLTTGIQAAAAHWNLAIQIAPTLQMARQVIASQLPDVVVLDLTFPDSTEDGLTLLAELSHEHPQLPVLVFTARDNFSDRLRVSRLGGRGFLHKPIPIDQLLQTITQSLIQRQPADAKVMVVDDDPAILDMLATLLQPWGLQVIPVQDSQEFWQVLTGTMPDLLVLDVEMPVLNGLELCQVVRQDPRWGDLPILVFTSHTDIATIQQVFAVGADDFVGKPVIGPELVTRILSRIERVHWQRKLTTAQRQSRNL